MKYVELVTANIGKRVDVKGVIHIVADLSEKLGKLKSGDEANYVDLKADDGSLFSLHPRKAYTLFSKGEEEGLKMLIDAVAEEAQPSNETETEANAATVPVVEPTVPAEATIVAATPEAPTPEVEKPSKKKALCVEAYKAGVAAGETRQQILTRFAACGVTSKPGQATYYQNCKNKKAGWE